MVTDEALRENSTEVSDIVGEEVGIPVYLFIEMFNAIPKSNDLLVSRVIEYVKAYQLEGCAKAHVVEGLTLSDSGMMLFNETLYREAMYQRKIDQYYEATKEALDDLIWPADILEAMMKKQEELANTLSAEVSTRKIFSGTPENTKAYDLIRKLSPLLVGDDC